jgi:23S rRNA (adenine2030-N6)-methyltransferase
MADCLTANPPSSSDTEIRLLKATAGRDRHIKIFNEDGLKNTVGLLPPKEHRWLVFVDPSYEIKNDYKLVAEALIQMYNRFATGTYALWYPLVERRRSRQLETIKTSGINNVLLFELGIKADTDERNDCQRDDCGQSALDSSIQNERGLAPAG